MSRGISLRHSGFTLIEVMITVAIIGILAAIAYPSYVEQVAKGKRAECRSGIMQTLQQQERYFGQYNEYVEVQDPPVTGSKVRSFSGDNIAQSSCYIASTACSGASIAQCVQITGLVQFNDPHKIENLYLSSDGVRGCKVAGTATSSDPKCWP